MRRRDFLPAVAAAPVLLARGSGAAPAVRGRWRFRSRRLWRFWPWRWTRRPAPLNRLPPSGREVVAPRKGGGLSRESQAASSAVSARWTSSACRRPPRLGIKGYDLINTPEQWAILKSHGLTPTMYQRRPCRRRYRQRPGTARKTTTGWKPSCTQLWTKLLPTVYRASSHFREPAKVCPTRKAPTIALRS